MPWKFVREARASFSSTSSWSSRRPRRRSVRRRDPSARRPPGRSFIRIASFNLDGLDEAKLANRRVGDVLVRVLPHFDVIALQGVRAKNRGLLVRLVEQLNATGPILRLRLLPDRRTRRRGARTTRSSSTAPAWKSIARRCISSSDPAGRFRHKPLVGRLSRPRAARDRGLHLHADQRADRSRPARRPSWTCWPPSIRAVRDDGRNEDDIILLGDLEADPSTWASLGRVPDLMAAVTGVAHHHARHAGWPTTSSSTAAPRSSSPAARACST